MGGVMDTDQLMELQYWLTPQNWYNEGINANPYAYTATGVFSCDPGQSFRIDWPSTSSGSSVALYSACAMCSKSAMNRRHTCQTMMRDVSTFVGCDATSAAIQTAQHVCQNCPSFSYATPLVLGNTLYGTFPLPKQPTDPSWPCRYSCPTGMYVNTYLQNRYNNYIGTNHGQGPCLPCPTPGIYPAVCGAGQYFDDAIVCGVHGSTEQAMYIPPCSPCLASLTIPNSEKILFVDPNYSLNKSGCLAVCASGYLTQLKGGGYAMGSVVLDSVAGCQPCSSNLSVPCGGNCSASFYMSSYGTCAPCSTTCDLGSYRGKLSAAAVLFRYHAVSLTHFGRQGRVMEMPTRSVYRVARCRTPLCRSS